MNIVPIARNGVLSFSVALVFAFFNKTDLVNELMEFGIHCCDLGQEFIALFKKFAECISVVNPQSGAIFSGICSLFLWWYVVDEGYSISQVAYKIRRNVV